MYTDDMTELLEEAIEKIRQLTADEQNVIADVILDYVDQDGAIQLSAEQAQEVRRRLSDPDPQFAPIEAVAERFRRRLP